MTVGPDPADVKFIVSLEDLNCLADCFNAAIQGEEAHTRLTKMWNQQIGIIRANPITSGYPAVLDEIYEKYKHLDLLLGDPEMCGGTAIYTIAGELLRAIKKARGEK